MIGYLIQYKKIYISDKLLSLKLNIPCDFSPKPRALNELPRFETTELRQILVYIRQIVFKDNISNKCYKHFMALNIVMTILLSDNMQEKYIDYARDLLKYFVKQFETLYGRHFIFHNVHSLLHIADDYFNFCSLGNIVLFHLKTI